MSETKPPDPGQAIQPIPRASVAIGRQGVMLNNLAELMAFAKLCVDGGLGPKGMTQASAAIAIQAGLERGMGPIGGLQSAVVINGVLSWRGSAVVGLIQNSPVIVPGTWKSWVENPGTDQAVGYCRAQRRGYDQPFVRSFSVIDAKKAGLWKKGGPWDSRPDNMLEWRAIGDMGRFHFYDVLGNLPIAEDVEAGGLGPIVPELPATRLPEPSPPVKDPILAELVPTTQTATGVEFVVDPSVPLGEVRFVNKDGSTAGKIVDLAPPSQADLQQFQDPSDLPGLADARSSIEASVDEAFPKAPEASGPGDPCPRCWTQESPARLNLMGDCDRCFYPAPEKP